MGQHIDSIARFLQYGFKVLPEVRRQAGSIADRRKLCIPQGYSLAAANSEIDITEQPGIAVLCSSLFALYPGVDIKNTLSFILSLYSLSDTLSAYRSKTGITDDAEIRKLYSCLSGAVDPSRSTGCALANLLKASPSQKKEAASSLCLSDQCRLQLSVLPSFSLVAPKLKKYMQFYVDLQCYRHYPAKIRSEYLETWSDYYLKRYQGIFSWEFCAASDSLLGIVAMYASATNPKLTAEDVRQLDEACFPWLCGLDSLLHSYMYERVSNNNESLNFTSFYKNLKTCEERLSFFTAKSEEVCSKLKENTFYLPMIKTLTGMYLTDSEASFGMHRFASLNILKNDPYQTRFNSTACKLLHLYWI